MAALRIKLSIPRLRSAPLRRFPPVITIQTRAMATSTPAPTDQPQGWGSFLWNKIGYETLPQDASNKSFYDLKAALPGKDKWLNMVSKLGLKDPDLV
jgi:hypothetical protein